MGCWSSTCLWDGGLGAASEVSERPCGIHWTCQPTARKEPECNLLARSADQTLTSRTMGWKSSSKKWERAVVSGEEWLTFSQDTRSIRGRNSGSRQYPTAASAG